MMIGASVAALPRPTDRDYQKITFCVLCGMGVVRSCSLRFPLSLRKRCLEEGIVQSCEQRQKTLLSHFMGRRLQNRSAIRQAFETANRMKCRFGSENVFDFSIGNPAAACPDGVRDALLATAQESGPALHGYMDSAGYRDVRETIAGSLARRFGTPYSADDLIMTTGAASAINTLMQTVLDPGDEVVGFLPDYPAYRVFVENWGSVMTEVPYRPESFLPDLDAFAEALSPRTKMVIVNTPNNPSGLVYPASVANAIAAILTDAQRRFGQPILLLSDEPYRELVYDGAENPWWPSLYRNTAVVYSFSKSASIAGERIGYVALTPGMDEHAQLHAGIRRSLGDVGFVNAPATSQRMAAACADQTVDIGEYDSNRRALLDALRGFGFSVVEGNGAFYLLLEAPGGNEELFLERMAALRLIAVGGTDFGCPGYVRLSYCLPHDAVLRSLPHFQALARECGLLASEGGNGEVFEPALPSSVQTETR